VATSEISESTHIALFLLCLPHVCPHFKLPVNPSAFLIPTPRPISPRGPSFCSGGIVPTFAASLSIPRPLARYVHACVPSRCRRTSFVHCLSICDLNSFNHHFLGIGPSISFHLTFRRLFIPVVLSYLGVRVCVCLPSNLMLSDCYF